MDRTGFLGGSDMPIVMGVSTYMTPYELWMQKTGSGAPKPQTESQECGHLFEAGIALGYETRFKVQLEKPVESYQHPRLPFLRAQVDRVRPAEDAGGPRIVEIKNVSEWAADTFGTPGTDEIPRDYYVQIQTQFACTEFTAPAHLYAAFGGNRMRLYVIERNEDAVEAIERCAARFWRFVEGRIAPPFVDTDLAAVRFPVPEVGHKVIATREIMELHERILKADRIEKQAARLSGTAKERVKMLMGTAESVQNQDGKVLVTWKRNATGTRVFLPKAS
jgi:putative phage-type endonuclease